MRLGFGRLLLSFASLLVLSGCAGPPRHWVKAGQDTDAQRRDIAQCKARAVLQVPVQIMRREVITPWVSKDVDGRPVYHEGVSSDVDVAKSARRTVFEGCMASAGWLDSPAG